MGTWWVIVRIMRDHRGLTIVSGRCPLGGGKRHVDVRNVIWLGTSNVGHELVFDYNASRGHSQQPLSREEYVELMGLLRPRISERLGVRITHFANL